MTDKPYDLEGDGIPCWNESVSHEDALESFCKVVRYWTDHNRATDIYCRTVKPPERIEDFIEAGLEWLWHFVVMPDEEWTLNQS